MERLKDPAMILSVTNTVGLVGTTVYFYRQIEAINAKLEALNKSLESVMVKSREVMANNQIKDDSIKQLSDQVKAIQGQISELPSVDVVDSLDSEVGDLIESLEDAGIQYVQSERPTYSRDQRGSRRHSPVRQPPPRRYEEDRRRPSRDDYSRRPEPRGYPASNPGPKPRGSQTQPQPEVDDMDLIAAVRTAK